MTERPIDEPDDSLLDDLSRALDAVDPVPPHVASAASTALAWRTIDAELAELTFDSAEQPLGVRSTDVNRQVTFRASGLEIELMIAVGARRRLVGQLIPPAVSTVELVDATAQRSVISDHLGRFTFDDLPSGPARLVVSDAVSDEGGAPPVQTGWLLL